jgi:hypothetical protein
LATADSALIQTAETLRRDRDLDHLDLAAILAGREQFYRALAGLCATVGVVHSAAPPADHPASEPRNGEVGSSDPGMMLAIGLTAAAAHHHRAYDFPSALPAVHHLRAARQAVRTARDIVVSHLGTPGTGTRSPQGHALWMGAARRPALADLATLASRALVTDRLLHRLLHRAPARADPRNALLGHDRDRIRWWLDGHYPAAITRLAHQRGDASLLHSLDVNPPSEWSDQHATIRHTEDVAETINRASLWMFQQPASIGVIHVRAATNLALAIAAADVRLTPQGPSAALRAWSATAKTLTTIAGVGGTGRTEIQQRLALAGDWVRTRLYQHLTGRPDPDLPEGIHGLAQLLPDFAAGLSKVVTVITLRSELFLDASDRPGRVHPVGQRPPPPVWTAVTAGNAHVNRLKHHLRAAAAIPTSPRGTQTSPRAIPGTGTTFSPAPSGTCGPPAPAARLAGQQARAAADTQTISPDGDCDHSNRPEPDPLDPVLD